MVQNGNSLGRMTVSICILHYNRIEELIKTIAEIDKSDFKEHEIIIVDNASTSFDKKLLKKSNSKLRIIELKKNVGISGWNYALKAARGEFFLLLDDDSYPEKGAIKKAIKYFNENPSVSVIAAKVINNRTGNIETRDFNEKPDFFVGCGAFMRREVYEKIGGFNEIIFIYLHELDYSARVYSAGYNIKYVEEVIVYHNQSLIREYGNKADPYFSQFRFYNYSISYFIFLVSYFSLSNIIKYLPKWIINRLIVAISYKFWCEFFKFIFYVIYNLPKIWKTREPLPKSIQEFYRFGNIPLIDQDYFKK